MNIPGLFAHGGNEQGGVTLLVRSIQQCLMAGIIPVLHGDAGLLAMAGFEAGAGILGGDRLVEVIASHDEFKTRIEKVVFLTDVKGVYTKDPKVYEDAVLVRRIYVDCITGHVKSHENDKQDGNGDGTNIHASGSTHDHDVTGGLETKLEAAVNIAKLGLEVSITKCCSMSAEQAMKGVSDKYIHEGTTITTKVKRSLLLL